MDGGKLRRKVNEHGRPVSPIQIELHPPSVELGELALELHVGAEPGHLLRRHEVRDLLVRRQCRNSSFTDREILCIQI
jgi:hypothetical protein